MSGRAAMVFDSLLDDLESCVRLIKELEFIYSNKDAGFRVCPCCGGMCPDDYSESMSWLNFTVGHEINCDIRIKLLLYGHLLEKRY